MLSSKPVIPHLNILYAVYYLSHVIVIKLNKEFHSIVYLMPDMQKNWVFIILSLIWLPQIVFLKMLQIESIFIHFTWTSFYSCLQKLLIIKLQLKYLASLIQTQIGLDCIPRWTPQAGGFQAMVIDGFCES